MRSKTGLSIRNSTVERLALGVAPERAVGNPARLIEQPRGLPQQPAVLAGAVAHRRQHGLAEDLGPQPVAHRLEQRQFVRAAAAPSAFSGESSKKLAVRS